VLLQSVETAMEKLRNGEAAEKGAAIKQIAVSPLKN
jgi:hypothetical protein